jgi:gliding motility-associated-like protein
MKKFYLYLVFLLLIGSPVFSQVEANNWVFGWPASGIKFNPAPLTSFSSVGTFYSFRAAASISDARGKLLFYTNGQDIWGKNNNVILNGHISGNQNSNQGALIIPLPCDTNQYYFFYITYQTSVYELRYSVVHKLLGGGNGMVIANPINLKDKTVKADVTGKLTAIRHSNGVDVWIITQGLDGKFYSYLLTTAGWPTGNPPPPVVSNGPGPLASNTILGDGSMQPSNDGTKIGGAWGGNSFSPGFWKIYDFDKSAGTLTYSMTLNPPVGQKPCDISFSPNNQVVYCSAWNTGCYQHNLAAGDTTAIQSSQQLVGPAQRGLQLGPDGKIYGVIGFGDNTHLDVIATPDSLGAACNYQIDGYSLPSLKGVDQVLPNIPMNVFLDKIQPNLGPDQTLCPGKTITLSTGYSNAGSSIFYWQDSSTASTFVVTEPGKYWVTVCGASDTVLITPTTCDPKIDIPNIFTPNGDGQNDLFSAIKPENIETVETKIYDRWGKEVFSTDSITIDWNGKDKSGKECNDGTYFYMITYTGKDKKTVSLKGYVQLVR